MNRSVVTGLVGLVIGIVTSGAIAAWAVNGSHTRVMEAYAMNTGKFSNIVSGAPKAATHQPAQGNSMSMADMAAALQGKTGDAFDKAFISEMITHHQGAIDMAILALTNAKHQEVKDLAKNIISAQNNEITGMQSWQQKWGYTTSGKNPMPGMNM